MHEDVFPPERHEKYALEAFLAHCFAALGVIVFLSAWAFLVANSLTQLVLARFGLVIFGVCGLWSASLAARSIWCREGDRSAWVILALCLLELNVPAILCFTSIFNDPRASSWKDECVRWGVPLWAPILSYVLILSTWITRRRVRTQEKLGRKISGTAIVRIGFRRVVIVFIPALIALPVLLFIYSIASVNVRAGRETPSDWRKVVLEHTPNLVTDPIARIFRRFRIDRTSESMLISGWVSESYLLEIIDTRKEGNDELWYAFIGLNRSYPDSALRLARTILVEPYAENQHARFRSAAFIFSSRASVEEVSKFLSQPSDKADIRRASLVLQIGYHKRMELEMDVYRIAIDPRAPDRLYAISALSEFKSSVLTLPLWLEFLETADPSQHASVRNLSIPSSFQMRIFQRVLEDNRTPVLRCWLESFYISSSDYEEKIPLLLRLLELSEHSDLSVRRGALLAIAYTLNDRHWGASIPEPWADRNDEGWWKRDSATPETEKERDAADALRAYLCDILGRRL